MSGSGSLGWPLSVLCRLGGLCLLLLLEGAVCLASPSSPSGVNNNNNQPHVNIYMSVEEVKKLLEVLVEAVTCCSSCAVKPSALLLLCLWGSVYQRPAQECTHWEPV